MKFLKNRPEVVLVVGCIIALCFLAQFLAVTNILSSKLENNLILYMTNNDYSKIESIKYAKNYNKSTLTETTKILEGKTFVAIVHTKEERKNGSSNFTLVDKDNGKELFDVRYYTDDFGRLKSLSLIKIKGDD